MTTATDTSPIDATVRELLTEVTRLRSDPGTLAATDDLFAAGLSSLATVELMLAVEDRFGIEFTSTWLNRRTFASIASLTLAIRRMQEEAP